jgi:divinyl protochlorophyllide a 8-vinyl-reductase
MTQHRLTVAAGGQPARECPPEGAAARIGPNAVTQMAAALQSRLGDSAARRVFEMAGLSVYWLWPPDRMLPEAEVARLHRTVREALGSAMARDLAVDAGRRTADYLLARRIPRGAQLVLRVMPAAWSAQVLMRAIARHAWTFAGSGRFAARPVSSADGSYGPASVRWLLSIADNPLCRGLHLATPACDFYAAVFQRLAEVLVHAQAQVREVACEARGDASCRFELAWP